MLYKYALDSINSTHFMRNCLILWQSRIWLHIWCQCVLIQDVLIFVHVPNLHGIVSQTFEKPCMPLGMNSIDVGEGLSNNGIPR